MKKKEMAKGINNSRGTSIWVLSLLASLHLFAELGHFLIGVVSQYVARDVHYGTQACFVNRNVAEEHFNMSGCSLMKTKLACDNVTMKPDGLIHACHWDWTGLGGEYQFLAGPSFMAMFTVASIVWGILADKYDRVNILFASSVLCSLALIFTSVATKFWHLVSLRMMLAAGVAGIPPIAPGIICDMFSQEERALAMGFFHWGIYLGNGLTFVVGKYITEMNLFNAGWRSTFVISGLPGAMLAILVMFTVEDPPKSHKSTDSRRRISKNHSSSPIKSFEASIHHGHHHHHSINHEEDNEIDETEVNEECCDSIDEAQVLIANGAGGHSKSAAVIGTSGNESKSGLSCCFQPVVFLLGLGACLRHSAGYTWGYNSALYFQTYYPTYKSTNIWLTWITIFGGSFGVLLGGYLSDKLVSRLGIASRALVLAASQLISTPFAMGLLYLNPPYAFFSLFIGYLFAEMWYGVVFAILVELLPVSFRSVGLAISLFVVNNVGGNLPIIVTSLASSFGFRGALAILYPGGLLISSFLFFMTYLALLRK